VLNIYLKEPLMAKSGYITLTKKEQQQVLSKARKGMSAYQIHTGTQFPRRQEMHILENNGIASYSANSYK
jgi:hypothetical protein